MAITCTPLPFPAGFLSNTLNTVDCYNNTFVQNTYLSFFGNGTVFGHVLTGVLVLAIAFFGISVMIGRSNMSLGNLAPFALKITFIIAITATWGTFSLQAQGHRASALNLVAGVIVLWNTTYLEAARKRLGDTNRAVPQNFL